VSPFSTLGNERVGERDEKEDGGKLGGKEPIAN